MDDEENKSKRKILSFLCGKTGLLFLVILYTLFGALIFKALEGGTEAGIPQDIQRSREDCLRELWLITERLNVLYQKNWTKLVTEQLKRFEKVVVESGNSPVSKKVEDPWTFGGALLYTLTLLTTVGYGKLSPKTTFGKIIAMIYALIGVPLMLVLLSLLGSMLANGAKIAYSKIRCKEKNSKQVNTVVGFHKPSSGSGKNKSEDCSIQILPHNNQNSVNYKTQEYHIDHLDVPKKAILATVRASHARGRCRQGQVRQMLADPHFCPSTHHGTTSRSITGSLTSDVEETEENEDSEHGVCIPDTPSRVPLICRPNDSSIPNQSTSSQPSHQQEPPPPVPAVLVLAFFSSYVCLGASVFATVRGWNFLDAAYFCFAALSTIGVFDALPNSPDIQAQLQLIACCLYLFLGLIVVAMCFTLVQDEVTYRCRRLAKGLGFG